jgi:hypothetical protein
MEVEVERVVFHRLSGSASQPKRVQGGNQPTNSHLFLFLFKESDNLTNHSMTRSVDVAVSRMLHGYFDASHLRDDAAIARLLHAQHHLVDNDELNQEIDAILKLKQFTRVMKCGRATAPGDS